MFISTEIKIQPKNISSFKNLIKQSLSDRSLISLIIINFLTIILSIIEHLPLGDILFIYWCQSVIIGFFQFFKILELKKYHTLDEKRGQSKIPIANIPVKIWIATFFVFHYGFFHLAYLVFILQKNPDILASLPLGITFFINHFYSYLKNHKKDSEKIRVINHVMGEPYLRIIPMHLVIMIGGGLFNSTIALVFFQILKTLTDSASHIIEHKTSAQSISEVTSPKDFSSSEEFDQQDQKH